MPLGDSTKLRRPSKQPLSYAARTEQHNWDAELGRIKAQLMLETDSGEAVAEHLLEESLALARRQGARSLELRVAITLARLWKRRDRRNAARQLMSTVCSRFDEGFDTPDLLEAAALLEELV